MNIKDSYQYIARKDDTWTSIGIRGGKFDGVVYKYGKVTFPEEETPEGDLPFKFEYDILDPNGLSREQFNNEFFTIIGDILVDIIDEQMKEENLEYRNNTNN